MIKHLIRYELARTYTLTAVLCAAAPALAWDGVPPPGWTEELTGLRAIDGDTLVAPNNLRIRLAAIDAPELKQVCSKPDGSMYDCGAASRAALQALLDGSYARGWTITCHLNSAATSLRGALDKYGRAIASCNNSAGDDLGGMMVRVGWAVPYYKYGGERYAPQYRHAVTMNRGMHDGTFDDPEAWRRAIAQMKEKGLLKQ